MPLLHRGVQSPMNSRCVRVSNRQECRGLPPLSPGSNPLPHVSQSHNDVSRECAISSGPPTGQGQRSGGRAGAFSPSSAGVADLAKADEGADRVTGSHDAAHAGQIQVIVSERLSLATSNCWRNDSHRSHAGTVGGMSLPSRAVSVALPDGGDRDVAARRRGKGSGEQAPAPSGNSRRVLGISRGSAAANAV